MKQNDSGDFCLLSIEQADERTTLFNTIASQQKPIIIILMEEARLFQRPDDYTALKHVKRQIGVPITFVTMHRGHLTQLANRHGFPAYSSMDALADAISMGYLGRQRTLNRTTGPLREPHHVSAVPRRTVPLLPLEDGGELPPAPVATVTRHSSGGMASEAAHPAEADKSVGTASEVAHPTELHKSTSTKRPPQGGSLHINVGTSDPATWLRSSSRAGGVGGRNEKLSPLVGVPSQSTAPLPLSKKPRGKRLPMAMIFFALIALLLAGIGGALVFSRAPLSAVPAGPAGHITFLSSEQVSENNSQGIDDQVVVDLTLVARPAQGKSYYAWLLGDKSQADMKTIALGALQITNAHAHLFYAGDAQHTNLLLITSRFLITEEDVAIPPIVPSPDMSTWRYYAEFAQTPINKPGNPQHYSYLDHLRHLLASDPALEELELSGGLNNWFYQNTSKILEWTSSMRGQWEDTKDTGFLRRQTMRTLTYLDGLSFVQQDLPPKTPLLVNERLARIGLLPVGGPDQEPASYLDHINRHLNGLLQSGLVTPALREKVAGITTALSDVKFWLGQVRQDALRILKMNDQQLSQPGTLTIINDMIDNATHAYTGQIDPNTGQIHEGVVWIHDHMQELATMDINTFSSHGSALQMIPDLQHARAMRPTS